MLNAKMRIAGKIGEGIDEITCNSFGQGQQNCPCPKELQVILFMILNMPLLIAKRSW